MDEPYTAKPRSSYGGINLTDCQMLIIPKDKVFVMGDNRKASLDSRFELGLVGLSDIKYVEKVDAWKLIWNYCQLHTYLKFFWT